MNEDRKKQLARDYKKKCAVGAVYQITCGGSGRKIVKSTVDMDAIQSRFQFALATKSCPDPALRAEWLEYGAESFSLSVLEEIKKKEDQSSAEFAEDVKALREMWLESPE